MTVEKQLHNLVKGQHYFIKTRHALVARRIFLGEAYALGCHGYVFTAKVNDNATIVFTQDGYKLDSDDKSSARQQVFFPGCFIEAVSKTDNNTHIKLNNKDLCQS